jgi:RHS repeat-associated protein
LTVNADSRLLVDLKKFKIQIKKDGGLLIKKGGTVRQVKYEDVNPTVSLNYHLTDHLGSITLTSDNLGNIVELNDYYPYGSIRVEEGSSSKEQRKYIGQEFDASTGLSYLNARYYDGNRGQFLNQDPVFWSTSQDWLLDPQNQNSYSYARNNPITLSDPSGLLTIIIPGTFYETKDWSFDGKAKNFLISVGNTFGDTKQGENLQILNWSGENSDEARSVAAISLANTIKDYKFTVGEKLNIVGHSHGGNIAIMASQNPDVREIDTLVTLGTPNRTYYQPGAKIKSHVNVYSRFDKIQRFGEIGDVFKVMGPDLQKFDGAENFGVGLRAGIFPRSSHSNLWKASSVWSLVNKKLESKKKTVNK